MYQDLTILGLGISQYEMSTLEDHTKTVLNFKKPVTVGELYHYISMFCYYKIFIRNFAKLPRPLNELKMTK